MGRHPFDKTFTSLSSVYNKGLTAFTHAFGFLIIKSRALFIESVSDKKEKTSSINENTT